MVTLLISTAVLLASALPDGQTAAPAPATTAAPGNETICQRDLKADLYFLASDKFRGRLTATPENDLATEFVASRFERLGLKRMGPGESYYQRFSLSTATLGESNGLVVANGGVTLRYPTGQGFAPLRFSPSGEATGQVVFVGFGIVAPEYGHDDYKDTEVRGKLVMVLEHEPGEKDPESPFDGVVLSEAATPFRKALTAQQRGAVGILFVSDRHNHPGPEDFEGRARSLWPDQPPRIPSYTLQDWVERVRIPSGVISAELARTLLRDPERSIEELGRESEHPRGGAAVEADVVVTITTDVRRHVVHDRNIVAAIEGADPKARDEWVLISCHQDHDGADGARVYNGADDNGSGTVGLIEIAEAYALAAQKDQRPRRSILFAAFNSEERGLLGSWAFTEHPVVPLERIVAVLNMDMVGRDEEVPVGGGSRFLGLPVQTAESNRNAVNLLGHSRSRALTETIERANASFGLTLKKVLDNNPSNLLRRSDQWPFLERGVPAVYFHTGLHPDYHTPGDRPEKIHYAKMERIIRLVHQASWDLAQAPGRPALDKRGKK